jgi:serine protease
VVGGTKSGLGVAGLTLLLAFALPPVATAEVARDADFVQGEVLVRFDSRSDTADRAAALQAVEGETGRRLFVPGLRLVRLDGTSVRNAVAELERRPGVRFAEPNVVDRTFAVPNDPEFVNQFGLHNFGQTVNGVSGTPDADIDAPQAWDLTRGSGSVTVAIVDTGVDYNHPDLAPNIVPGHDFFDNDNDPAPGGSMSAQQHGTRVAGVAGARGNNGQGITGVAQGVDLMPLRVGNGPTLQLAAQIEAFGYAAQHGADIVNFSGGGTTFSPSRLAAIRSAPNTLFVFSAGNGGADGIGDNNDVTQIFPCNHNESNVVCVASTTQDDVLASSSNFGRETVDLAAPGRNIRTTSGPGASYVFVGGTSFAAPMTAGAAALLKSRYPNDTPARLRTRLMRGVEPKGLPVTSGGRLNVNDSLRADIDPPSTSITRGPKPKVKSRKRRKKARFEFASSEVGTFQCSLDGGEFEPCLSPFQVKVRRGFHELQVRAIDAAFNADPTPVAHTWKLKRKRSKKHKR